MQELAAEEFHRGSKLTPAISSGSEAINNKLQRVVEVTVLPKGVSFLLVIPVNSTSATYNVSLAEPLYQRNDDRKNRASVSQFPQPYLEIATDKTNFAELAASTLQQCAVSNLIKLYHKSLSTTTDETLTLPPVTVFYSRRSSTSELPCFLCLSCRSPTGDLFGKWRPPLHLSQPHNRYQERQHNKWTQFVHHRLSSMLPMT